VGEQDGRRRQIVGNLGEAPTVALHQPQAGSPIAHAGEQDVAAVGRPEGPLVPIGRIARELLGARTVRIDQPDMALTEGPDALFVICDPLSGRHRHVGETPAILRPGGGADRLAICRHLAWRLAAGLHQAQLSPEPGVAPAAHDEGQLR